MAGDVPQLKDKFSSRALLGFNLTLTSLDQNVKGPPKLAYNTENMCSLRPI